MRLPSHGASSFADIDIPVSLVSPNVYMRWYKLLQLTTLRVAEVRVFGCGSMPEGTNRNIHFPGSSNNLPISLGTYSQARTEHQQNPCKTTGHKTRLNLRKVPPNGTQGTQGNRIKLTKGSPLKQAKHNSAPAPRKDQLCDYWMKERIIGCRCLRFDAKNLIPDENQAPDFAPHLLCVADVKSSSPRSPRNRP